MSNFEFTRKLPWREIALLRTFKIIGAFLRLLLKVWQLEEYQSHVTRERVDIFAHYIVVLTLRKYVFSPNYPYYL